MMVVAHNLLAMNGDRMLGINTNKKAKSTEKLSSGYRINRAADDAAGLAISEKMRRQIRGLTQASQNIQDGISFCQVADGYLNEVHDIMQRINELAVKSENGTNSSEDRFYMDEEVQQLKKELNRIFKTAEFNELKIWDEPYMPEPEFVEGTQRIAELTSTELPPRVEIDAISAASGHMSNTYTDASGTTYQAAAYLDFSGIDLSDSSQFDGTGFYSTCCTCDDYYSITFDSWTDQHSVSGTQHYTYTVGIAGCATAADVVGRIVGATGGCPNNHYTNYEVYSGDASGSTLVIYDNRPDQKASVDSGYVDAGVRKEKVLDPGDADIQVFNSGIDSAGRTLYGGVEINDVRHTWEEMEIEIDEATQTFKKDQEIEFEDYTGERVCLKVQQGDALSKVTRNYKWSADENGVSVNNKLAATWSEIGIKDTDNSGSYSFVYHNFKISFSVDDGDSLQDVIDGIGGKVLDSYYTWDLTSPVTEKKQAVDLTCNQKIKITENNKDIVDLTYSIYADTDGITLVDNAGNTHSSVAWEDFTNQGGTRDGEFPVVDWGLDDVDRKGQDSDAITFDDEAVYRYTDTVPTDFNLSFSFVMADEASRDAVLAGLDDVEFSGAITAPGSVSADVSESAEVQVLLKTDSLFSDATLKEKYGMDPTDPSAELTGSITRTFVRGTDEDGNAQGYYVYSGTFGGEAIKSVEGERFSIPLEGDVAYMDTVALETASGTPLVLTYNNYPYMSGSVQSDIVYKATGELAVSSSLAEPLEITDITSYMDFALQRSYGRDFDDPNAELTGQIVRSRVWDDDTHTTGHFVYSGTFAGEEIDEVTGSSWTLLWNASNYIAKEEVTVTTESGTAMKLTFANNLLDLGDESGMTTVAIAFQASDYAYSTFTANENTANNVTRATQFTDIQLNTPERELFIHSNVEAYQGITLKWDNLSNATLGISGSNVLTATSAAVTNRQIKKAMKIVSKERSDFGAYQNRLEHAQKLDDNVAENTTAAESRIRDADMAKEMVELSRQNILEQVSQSMLAQANQTPQGVLSLLS